MKFYIIKIFGIITNLRKPTKERYFDLCYFLIVTTTSLGYGDMIPISDKGKWIVSIIMTVFYILVVSLSIHSLK